MPTSVLEGVLLGFHLGESVCRSAGTSAEEVLLIAGLHTQFWQLESFNYLIDLFVCEGAFGVVRQFAVLLVELLLLKYGFIARSYPLEQHHVRLRNSGGWSAAPEVRQNVLLWGILQAFS